jgi:thioredoxin-like negative regulator of GroEL
VAAAAEHRVELKIIDIKKAPELAARYSIRLTPTTFVVAPGGTVKAGWLGTPPDGEVEAALGSLAGIAGQ